VHSASVKAEAIMRALRSKRRRMGANEEDSLGEYAQIMSSG